MTRSKHVDFWKNSLIGLVFVFLYLPILVIIVFSFNTSKLNILFKGFTFKWYALVFHNVQIMSALENTLIVGIISTALATIIGTLGAIGMQKYNFPGKAILDKVLYIPIVIPEVVLGIALLSIYSLAGIPLSLFSLILAHVTFCIPFVVLTVRSRLVGIDQTLEEAALDLGATPLKAFIQVLLPLLIPGIISGAGFSFALSIDDVIISFFTTGPASTTFPLQVYAMVKTGITPEINAISTLMMLVIVVGIAANAIFQVSKLKRSKRK
ncbi:ABC transporter permease [Lentilactobacillus farraginis]|uniref:Spermidine putrescine ABC superfamily ATP binding cassette transporter, membrane protein n=1 Tax=Lentilactobacillus farraginis DSM 18382 = JCM 14108 TaxID=1423743 RepID=X0PCD2_9LACO|nr:ABC transporter permease [Lentilactobacillus farraginis]KRM11197.1 spermidine putrescine ABC superfamily ATP binding cassette transporter, membrane protein [Lentilactobacillus farraginis DSM 18382 = JCM 14108]GAF37978.1 spermidine putrescine ABC transporter permease component PotC [Lentilactobacillus farraginis DSM 18382 = JCM 14108]